MGQFSPALPLTADEISQFGLTFKPAFLQPLITEEYLSEKLGDLAEKAKEEFLVKQDDGTYHLRPEYDTQRKVQAACTGKNSGDDVRMLEGLYALISNVLFVTDAKDTTKYHPRIAALTDGYFKTLSAADQQAFTKLYNHFFFERHNQFWGEAALQKLPGLTQATRMLACAEDLGMVPACVPPVMQKLQLLSLEIERMPKALNRQFNDIKKYPYLSVATPSTHDMSVLRGWWKENQALTQQFWHNVLGRPGAAPAELDTDTCTEIIRLHLASASMLALIGLQDLNAMDDTQHYWRYRMPMTLEKLLDASTFNEKIKQMIKKSGR